MSAAVDDTPTGWVQTVFTHRQTGRRVVASRELAVLTAHTHSNILQAVNKALKAQQDLAGAIFWHKYRGRNGQKTPCCHLAREALIATCGFLHNVPRSGTRIADVLDTYLEMIDAPEAAEPAPDSAIAPPDPEPADTLEPSDRARPADAKPASWEINYAIEIIQRSDQPEHLKRVNKAWNDKRLEALAAEIYATEDPNRGKT